MVWHDRVCRFVFFACVLQALGGYLCAQAPTFTQTPPSLLTEQVQEDPASPSYVAFLHAVEFGDTEINSPEIDDPDLVQDSEVHTVLPEVWAVGEWGGGEWESGEWGVEESIAPSASQHPLNVDTVRDFLQNQQTTPAQFSEMSPWWESVATQPLALSESSIVVNGDQLIFESLRHSYRIATVNENVCIARTRITNAAADFDPTAFVNSKFIRTSVPTGSALDAGNNVQRLREEDFSFEGGLRRKNQLGGDVEIGQQLGLRDSNSQFFTPANQGNSRLTLSFNQPLLGGAGKAFNRSMIVLAKLDTHIAKEAATTAIQDHLLAVQESMWNLYFQRASLLLRIRHLNQAKNIYQWLDRRRDLDSLESQIKRAEAAIAARNSELARAVTAIRNAEDRLRSLVNSPLLSPNPKMEIVPARPPSTVLVPVSMEDAIVTALQQRSEMNEVARELDSARVRLNVACNELLPMLDLVLETYVSGLRGSHDIGRSWIDQFSVGEPSYTAGLKFEVPLYRRAAKANVHRRQAEIRKLGSRLSETIAQLHAEVSAAVREVETSHRELAAKFTAMKSADQYVQLISQRWRELPGDGFSANSLLEDLLDAQDRLLAEEIGFARAQVDYALSTTQLKRATGTLLQIDSASGVVDSTH